MNTLVLDKAQLKSGKTRLKRGLKFVAKKTRMTSDGKSKTKYVYRASKAWEPIPIGVPSFEITNKNTKSIIHVTTITTDSSLKVNGTIRNKDGEVLAKIDKEVNSGDGHFYEYRKWNPNRARLIDAVAKELMLHDKAPKGIREIERSIQDSGLFPDEAEGTREYGLAKGAKLNALKEMSTFIQYVNVTDRTKVQLQERMKQIFDSLDGKDKLKALGYMFAVTK